MIKTTRFKTFAAGLVLTAVLPGAARAHEIEAIHVHQSHLAQGIYQGLGLAVLVAVVLGAVFLARRSSRR